MLHYLLCRIFDPFIAISLISCFDNLLEQRKKKPSQVLCKKPWKTRKK